MAIQSRLLNDIKSELKGVFQRKSLYFGHHIVLFNELEVQDVVDAKQEHIRVD